MQDRWLGQGTIYPDVIRSNFRSRIGGPSETIKSSYNVGGSEKWI